MAFVSSKKTDNLLQQNASLNAAIRVKATAEEKLDCQIKKNEKLISEQEQQKKKLSEDVVKLKKDYILLKSSLEEKKIERDDYEKEIRKSLLFLDSLRLKKESELLVIEDFKARAKEAEGVYQKGCCEIGKQENELKILEEVLSKTKEDIVHCKTLFDKKYKELEGLKSTYGGWRLANLKEEKICEQLKKEKRELAKQKQEVELKVRQEEEIYRSLKADKNRMLNDINKKNEEANLKRSEIQERAELVKIAEQKLSSKVKALELKIKNAKANNLLAENFKL